MIRDSQVDYRRRDAAGGARAASRGRAARGAQLAAARKGQAIADASIGASLESCAACSALSAANVQRAAAAASDGIVVSYSSGEESSDDDSGVAGGGGGAPPAAGDARGKQRARSANTSDSPVPRRRARMHAQLERRATASDDEEMGPMFLHDCLREDASIGASLESCAACSALSAADVQRAAAAAGGAASVATPPRTTANTVQSRPPCAATGAKRKAADHRCIECGNASVDAAGANLC